MKLPLLGYGCGLRIPQYPHLLSGAPTRVDWFEIIVESFTDWSDGTRLRSREVLEAIRKNHPVVAHGVSLSLGSTAGVDRAHLLRVKQLLEEFEISWFSDHVCWTGAAGTSTHDLLPLPYTQEAVRTVSENIARAQDVLGQRILIENLSSYVTFRHSEMTEWEFLSEVVQRADCGLLLDINNVFVSSRNHRFDPWDYLNGVPAERVGQIHLAGHYDAGTHLVDTHSEPVCDEVWELYESYTHQHGPRSTLIEWDDNLPEFSRVEQEVERAREKAEVPHAHPDTRSTPAHV